MPTKILKCTCDHEYQDEHYGDYKRVHNECTKDNRTFYRCTVCGAEREAIKRSIVREEQ
jgi:hypothetical protein